MTRVIDDEFNPTPEQAEYLSERASSAEAAEERLRAADASDALGEYVCRMPGRADVFVVLDGLVRLRARVAELGRVLEAQNRSLTAIKNHHAAESRNAHKLRERIATLEAERAELEAKVAAPPWETLNVLDGEIDRLQAEVDRCHALYPSLAVK